MYRDPINIGDVVKINPVFHLTARPNLINKVGVVVGFIGYNYTLIATIKFFDGETEQINVDGLIKLNVI
jgi:hypothetical protein